MKAVKMNRIPMTTAKELSIIKSSVIRIEKEVKDGIHGFKRQSDFAIKHNVRADDTEYIQCINGFCDPFTESLIDEFDPYIDTTYGYYASPDDPDWFKCEWVRFDIDFISYYKCVEDVIANTTRITLDGLGEIVSVGIQKGVEKALNAGTATLKQIQTEREQIERQLELLDQAEEKAAIKERDRSSTSRSLVGYVYLLRAIHDATLFKIGRTDNPNNRLKTFNVKLPFPIEYHCLVRTNDMYSLESELHEKFTSKRLDGEWFRLDQTDVDYIRSLAGAT